ncbi:MAG: gfo/Idh/MocA family oxidoreductase [Planctomycetota bacterium]|nr:MAG: gfo/Idh/MocA family oxidoreductase [Planctomycetota bacterium]
MRMPSVGLGVVGCGGFGLFALQQFVQAPGVRLVAMAGTHRPAAIAAGRRFGVPDVEEVDQLLRRGDVDIVYIATPPFLHYEQAAAALKAGKHVIVEKPLALHAGQADELCRLAEKRELLLVPNQMQRYNPLFGQVRRLIASGVLGAPLHGYFENYAADEGLGPDHWFWDRAKSGGIFLEHGVHFFDLLAGWLGDGRVVAAQRTRRPESNVEEQVACTVRYAGGALFQYYHGFHQPGRMDRQELRIVFERGDVTLFGWIPCRATIRALVDEEQTRMLCEIFPDSRLSVTESYSGTYRACRGRHREIDAAQLIEIEHGAGVKKLHRYGELLRALLADQLAWLRDRSHERIVTAENGRLAVRLAAEATRLADEEEASE